VVCKPLSVFLRVAVHLVAADGGGVLLGIKARELPIEVRHVVGQAARLGDQPLGRRQIGAQLVHHAGRQAGEVARLVHQHLRFVLELANLVVYLFEGTDCSQRVLHIVGRIKDNAPGQCW
jgi:hypothetical protein